MNDETETSGGVQDLPGEAVGVRTPSKAMATAGPSKETALIADWLSSAPTYATNLPADDPGYEALVIAATGQADKDTAGVARQRVRMSGYVVNVRTMETPDGELLALVAATVLLEDGTTFSTTSDSLLRTLRMIAQMRGRGRWVPPVEATVTPKKGKQPGPYYLFTDVVVRPPVAQTKKK